jgi:hypothetical protein
LKGITSSANRVGRTPQPAAFATQANKPTLLASICAPQTARAKGWVWTFALDAYRALKETQQLSKGANYGVNLLHGNSTQ